MNKIERCGKKRSQMGEPINLCSSICARASGRSHKKTQKQTAFTNMERIFLAMPPPPPNSFPTCGVGIGVATDPTPYSWAALIFSIKKTLTTFHWSPKMIFADRDFLFDFPWQNFEKGIFSSSSEARRRDPSSLWPRARKGPDRQTLGGIWGFMAVL